jgi:hypothetical protein
MIQLINLMVVPDKTKAIASIELSTVSSPLKRSLLHYKSGFIREVISLEGGNLVVYYYLSISEIWPYKEGQPLVRVAIIS